jgi:hypothetical protein
MLQFGVECRRVVLTKYFIYDSIVNVGTNCINHFQVKLKVENIKNLEKIVDFLTLVFTKLVFIPIFFTCKEQSKN